MRPTFSDCCAVKAGSRFATVMPGRRLHPPTAAPSSLRFHQRVAIQECVDSATARVAQNSAFAVFSPDLTGRLSRTEFLERAHSFVHISNQQQTSHAFLERVASQCSHSRSCLPCLLHKHRRLTGITSEFHAQHSMNEQHQISHEDTRSSFHKSTDCHRGSVPGFCRQLSAADAMHQPLSATLAGEEAVTHKAPLNHTPPARRGVAKSDPTGYRRFFKLSPGKCSQSSCAAVLRHKNRKVFEKVTLASPAIVFTAEEAKV